MKLSMLRLRRFRVSSQWLRAMGVGVAATVVDWTLLEGLVHGAHVPPAAAKLVALVGGLSVQFVGSRFFTFQAQQERVHKQLFWFVLVEIATLLMQWALFQMLMNVVGLSLELANLLAPGLVYFLVSYPLWRLIFRPQATPSSMSVDPARG